VESWGNVEDTSIYRHRESCAELAAEYGEWITLLYIAVVTAPQLGCLGCDEIL
jgi:hypothetical protein